MAKRGGNKNQKRDKRGRFAGGLQGAAKDHSKVLARMRGKGLVDSKGGLTKKGARQATAMLAASVVATGLASVAAEKAIGAGVKVAKSLFNKG